MNPTFCQSGVNLGGWISQYKNYDHEHFKSFITAADIRQIASWGMDHLRLPVDYPILEDDDQPFVYKQSGFDYLESCLEWATENGLEVVLDLHKAPGYSFAETIEALKPMPLFTDPAVTERFYRLWEEIARRFLGRYPNLHFELLNEVNLASSDPWNPVVEQVVRRIRAIEQQRTIVVGSNNFCAVHTLQDLKLLDDENIVYTFHFYEPLLFTHQKAGWSPITRDFDTNLAYPGGFGKLGDFLEEQPQFKPEAQHLIGAQMDIDMLRQIIAPALIFQQATGVRLYCGEYGVIEGTDPISCRNWHRDFLAILRENQIGRAVWSYKRMNFGLVDCDGNVIDPALIKVICD